jgi:TRAP-type uncharacterized transport system substrate-binding protein
MIHPLRNSGCVYEPDITEPIQVLSYDLPLLVGAKVEQDLVRQIIATLAQHHADLPVILSDFRAFLPRNMARPLPCAYHPGAISFYRGADLWPGSDPKNQEEA